MPVLSGFALQTMRVLSKLFSPMQRAVVAFFRHDLTLRRSKRGLEVVLQERRATPRKPGATAKLAPQSAQAAQERTELQQMLAELSALLGEQPESRHTLRHLEFVHQAVAKRGMKALHKVPLDVLQKAHSQFEGLVTNWGPKGLASLRSKMAVAIIDREHTNPDAEADAYRTAAVLDSGLGTPGLPEVEIRSDDEALAAAYAALGNAAPAGPVERQAELGSPSAKAMATPVPRPTASAAPIKLRELQD
jgi:hypothetical protein